jgi:hypothetical protein
MQPVFCSTSAFLRAGPECGERIVRTAAEDLVDLVDLDFHVGSDHDPHSPLLEVFLGAPAIGLRDAVEDHGEEDDGDAGDEAAAHFQPLDPLQHLVTEPARADHRGDDHHGKRHHRRLVDACHDSRQGERNLHLEELLPGRRAEGDNRLDHLAIDLTDAEIGQPDDRRNGEEHGGEDGRDFARAEQHDEGDQIDEDRQRLHDVEQWQRQRAQPIPARHRRCRAESRPRRRRRSRQA